MKKPQRFLFFILLGLLFAGSLNFSRAAENTAVPATDSLSAQKDLIEMQWEGLDKTFNAALSVKGASKEELAKDVADRKSLSDQAKAWNKRVLQAGVFLPRRSFDVSGDGQRVRDYFDFCNRAADMEKAADRPMSLEKAGAAFSQLQAWADSGKVSTEFFVDMFAKIKTRARDGADLIYRRILTADQTRAQEMFDENADALQRYLSPKKYSAARGRAFGDYSRKQAGESPDSSAGNPADSAARNLALAEARSDSAAKAQAREKQAASSALMAKRKNDDIENDRVAFLSHACDAIDTLKDAESVRNAADRFLGQWQQHNADTDDKKALEERRDRKIRELDALATAAREAEAARQKVEKERRRLLSGVDEAITGKRYEKATALVEEYRMAGGDTVIAGNRINRITTQHKAEIEAATRRLTGEAQDAQRRAFKAVKISDMQAEQRKITDIPAKIKKADADSMKVLPAVDTALSRVESLLALAHEGDSLKAAWESMGKAFSQALSVSGTSKEELRLSSEERNRLSQNADGWNRKIAQDGASLPHLYCDVSGDALAVKQHLGFSEKVAALKQESLRPMSFEKADALLSQVQSLGRGSRIKISGADTIIADIKTQAGETAAQTDSAIARVVTADPQKALAMLNKNSGYLEKYGSKKIVNTLREKIRIQTQAN